MLSSLPDPGDSPLSMDEFNTYIVSNKLLINKVELENIVELYGTPTGIDLKPFLIDLVTDTSGEDPYYRTMYAEASAHEAHLALSGVSHIEFGEQHKPAPKHWGVPPNAQMKGHDGIMRDLPGGYGKGNAPMYNWVQVRATRHPRAPRPSSHVRWCPMASDSAILETLFVCAQENMMKDKKAQTTERGVKPYPFGNYSL